VKDMNQNKCAQIINDQLLFLILVGLKAKFFTYKIRIPYLIDESSTVLVLLCILTLRIKIKFIIEISLVSKVY
jgi:hypothetical protein